MCDVSEREFVRYIARESAQKNETLIVELKR
jgi:hypothetical protein